jgi:Flp pilus assembly protein TadD
LSGEKDGDILQALAEAQYAAGQKPEAMQTLRKAIQRNPDDKLLLALLREWEQR